MALDAAADHSKPPETHLSDRTTSIKSSRMKASQQHGMLSLTHNTVCK
jgi:hypothetical protein